MIRIPVGFYCVQYYVIQEVLLRDTYDQQLTEGNY